MNHLILGGTGTVGSRLIPKLLARGEHVRGLTRSADRASRLPRGVTSVVGDLTDPESYERTFHEVDSLFLLIGNTLTELHEGLVAVNEARRAGIQRVVYLSARAIESGPHIPHFAAKLGIEAALRDSGIPFTILRPNNFVQVDHWFAEAIVNFGVYPQPLGGVGVSRIDVDDVAEAAANALLLPDHGGRTYSLSDPTPLTGEDCARIYASVLGREVKYAGDDFEAYSAQARAMIPAWLLWDGILMYELFQAKGMVATEAELRETREILRRDLAPMESFARAMVESLTAASPAA
jgi:uncharacterized protein YbjT (DUF2867 family)